MTFRELLYEGFFFDLPKLLGVWNFAFQSFSNIQYLLHHTRPEHSNTSFKP